VSSTLVTQSRIASFMASLRVAEPGGHGHHRRAQQLHAVDVQGLALHVFRTHEHVALQTQARGDGGAGHAVLAGAGLGDDPRLAHVLGEQRLADVLFTLCAPVWLRSSRLRKMRAPPISSDQRRASYSGDGRPT
jgi:hypothetical protein